MHYTAFELLYFFFVYGLLGWCFETIFFIFQSGKFVNRGFLNGPLCPSYGVAMVLVLVFFENLSGHYLLQFFACMVITSVVAYFSGGIISKISGHNYWNYGRHFFLQNKIGLWYAVLWAAAALVAIYMLNPFLYILFHFIPLLVVKITLYVLLGLLLLDFISSGYSVHFWKREGKLTQEVSAGLENTSLTLGKRLDRMVRRRIYAAFPDLADAEPETGLGTPLQHHFAPGICTDKLIWVFAISALMGDGIETLYVWGTAGILMSRSSLLYGTFSVVWGIGAVVLTVMLHRLADREDRYIFIGGFFIGGTYEYMCSVFTELVFGTVFWDYSDMPLNIGGRTNVLFCVFWGLLSVVWIKFIYPRMSNLIEQFRPVVGKVLTWCLVLFFVLDILISAMAMLRYSARMDGTAQQNAVGTFLDEQYPDSLIEFVWPNMHFI